MCDISISSSSTESMIAGLISRIQTNIIERSKASGNTIVNAVENSAGDFIKSLKVEVGQEVVMMNSVGELLIAMANYIQAASASFADVDTTYNTTKIS